MDAQTWTFWACFDPLSLWLFICDRQFSQFTSRWSFLSPFPHAHSFSHSHYDLMDNGQRQKLPIWVSLLQSLPSPEFVFLNYPIASCHLTHECLQCLPASCMIKDKLICWAFKGLHNLDPSKHFRHNDDAHCYEPTIVPLSPRPSLSGSFPLPDYFLGAGRRSLRERALEPREVDSALISAATWLRQSEQSPSSLSASFSLVKRDWITGALRSFGALHFISVYPGFVALQAGLLMGHLISSVDNSLWTVIWFMWHLLYAVS